MIVHSHAKEYLEIYYHVLLLYYVRILFGSFHNSFHSCQKSLYSLAFWNLGTNVVPDNIMANLKHLS